MHKLTYVILDIDSAQRNGPYLVRIVERSNSSLLGLFDKQD